MVAFRRVESCPADPGLEHNATSAPETFCRFLKQTGLMFIPVLT